MDIRPAQNSDLARIAEIDGTVDSARYLHLDRAGEAMEVSFKLEERPLRERLIDRNALDDDRRFALKQVVAGIEEGIALAAEHDEDLIALAVAQLQPAAGTLELLDVRVDYDYRRQGIGSAMVYQMIATARERGLRAVAARARANNLPANQFLAKTGFELTGLNTHLTSNHDLVKETVTLFWYAALD